MVRGWAVDGHPNCSELLLTIYSPRVGRGARDPLLAAILWLTGSVDAGPPDSFVFEGSVRSCVEHGLETGTLLAGALPGLQSDRRGGPVLRRTCSSR
jgi:hypothetical protein